jgi:hypothetical protein
MAMSSSISQGFEGEDEHLWLVSSMPTVVHVHSKGGRSWTWLGYVPPPDARQPSSVVAPCRRRRGSLLSHACCAMIAVGATLPRSMPGRTQRRVDTSPAGSCRATGAHPCRPEQTPPPSGWAAPLSSRNQCPPHVVLPHLYVTPPLGVVAEPESSSPSASPETAPSVPHPRRPHARGCTTISSMPGP